MMVNYLFRPKKGKILILYAVVVTIGLANLLRLMFVGYETLRSKGVNLNGGQVTLVRASYHYHNIVSTVPAMENVKRKHNILLFVGIFSAPVRNDRRNAVRETWMTKCKMNKNVVCLFITDGQDVRGQPLKGEIKEKLENESRYYKDIIFANSPGGLNFGRRILWMYEWAAKRYDFQYVLRLDDDYFLCFDKLIDELQHHRPKKLFIWGWVHCRKKGNIYFDEAFIIITKDLIQSFLDRKNSTLLCQPYGDQSIGMWLNAISTLTKFEDKRLGDLKPREKIKTRNGHETCQSKLGIHKSYPEEMKLYWNISQHENKDIKPEVPPETFDCKFPFGIDENKYGARFAPKLCKDNPVWNFGEYHQGSQEKKKAPK